MTSDPSHFNRIATELHDAEQIQQEIDAQKRRGRDDLAANGSPRSEPDSAFVEPRTPTEKKLADIWAQFLGLERVSIHDDFFALGGHSIMATQILARGRVVFQVDIPMSVVFSGDFTVAELARVIDEYQIRQADPDELIAMMKELEELSDEEVRALLSGDSLGESLDEDL